jgi:hypothetical protein
MLDRMRMEFSVSERLMDQIAWVVRMAQFESLSRAGLSPTAMAPLLWRDHNARGLKRATAGSFAKLASASASV